MAGAVHPLPLGRTVAPRPDSPPLHRQPRDDEGEVLDLLVQRRRDKAVAVKLMRKLLKKQGFEPDGLVTDECVLRRGRVRNPTVGSPRPGFTREQSGREFAPADTTARAQDAAFQIARISSTLLVHPRRRPKHLTWGGSCLPIQRSEPDRATWSFPHQINLTFGRRSRRLHQDPACGGWG